MKPTFKADNTNNLILEDVVLFLSKVPPFMSLDNSAQQAVARNLSVEFYPKGKVILRQNDQASDFLRIIKKGGIKITMAAPQDSDEIVIDYRGEGDSFGFLSLVSRDCVRANFIAIEDTICYLLGKEPFLGLLDSHRIFTEYFLKSHVNRYISQTAMELQDKNMFHGGSDRLLFTTRVGDMAIKGVVSTEEDTTIREAANIMTESRISSILVFGSENIPSGIVTDRDLRKKVVATGLDVQQPVKGIMSSPVITVDAHDYCFEIVLKMIKHNIHHVVVIREGNVVGVVTNHDLMMLQGTSPMSLTKDIESQQDIDGLIPVSGKINGIVGLMLKEGAKAGNIIRVITEINDRLVRKVLELAEKRLGRPPAPYCWIVYGSEGRREQTFKTDQDNALIYADPANDAEADERKRYFEVFSEFVKEGLIRCGFPSCPANNMASNTAWRQPLRVWKKYFTSWIDTPTPAAVLNSVTFFDFRPLYGDYSLAESLREHLNILLKDQKVFLGHLANLAVHNQPPIGFLKSFVVEKSGEHKDQLNLKVKGLAPLIDIVRLFALEKGIGNTETIARIETLRSMHSIVQEYADDLEHAFELMMLLRIHHQYAQISSGYAPDNFIDPNRLSNLEKRSIKEAFHLISRIQKLIIELYKSLIW
jgi:CBS domain-containing protein